MEQTHHLGAANPAARREIALATAANTELWASFADAHFNGKLDLARQVGRRAYGQARALPDPLSGRPLAQLKLLAGVEAALARPPKERLPLLRELCDRVGRGVSRVSARADVAAAMWAVGEDLPGAEQEFRNVVDETRDLVGEWNPDFAVQLCLLANFLGRQETVHCHSFSHDEACTLYEQALTIDRGSVGEKSVPFAKKSLMYGELLGRLGRDEAAIEHTAAAFRGVLLAGTARGGGEGHPLYAAALTQHADMHVARAGRGDLAIATAQYLVAIAAQEKIWGGRGGGNGGSRGGDNKLSDGRRRKGGRGLLGGKAHESEETKRARRTAAANALIMLYCRIHV